MDKEERKKRKLMKDLERFSNSGDWIHYSQTRIKIMKKMNLTSEEITELDKSHPFNHSPYKYREKTTDYNFMPRLVHRDNKEVHNIGSTGRGGSNSIRYPRKTASKRVWKNFYNLFPHYAERDGWDGKTSSRYKGKE